MTTDKALLITGAAHRIGKALALDYAAQGWAVALHFRHSGQAAEELVAKINAEGGKAVSLYADLSQERSTQELMTKANSALGPLGCLVNNASTFEVDDIESGTRESWDRHFEPNLRAPLVLSQNFAAQLAADRLGVIVNLIDERVWTTRADYMSYTLTKDALWSMTKSLALALAPRIRVVGVGPGYTLPEVDGDEEAFLEDAKHLPLARPSTPQEVCDAIRYLMNAPSVTGQMIALDGGQHLMHAHPADRLA